MTKKISDKCLRFFCCYGIGTGVKPPAVASSYVSKSSGRVVANFRISVMSCSSGSKLLIEV